MTTTTVIELGESTIFRVPGWVVWIDTNMGVGVDVDSADWEMNSPPQPLGPALREADETRRRGFPTKILQEGDTPRADGMFGNPRTGGPAY